MESPYDILCGSIGDVEQVIFDTNSKNWDFGIRQTFTKQTEPIDFFM